MAAQAPPNVTKILEGVERRYNNTKTLKSNFTQVYKAGGRTRARESGVILMSKPGKTRWEYTDPAGKLFISDGKFSYAYYPEDNHAERAKMKETDDSRIPLAFLLGKLDFLRDFDRFDARTEGDDVFITAVPKSDKLLFTDISMLIAPDSTIRRIIIKGQDFSTFDYTFSGEERGIAISDATFTFTPPPGADYVDLAE